MHTTNAHRNGLPRKWKNLTKKKKKKKKQECRKPGVELRLKGEISKTGRQRVPDRWCKETERVLTKWFQITVRHYKFMHNKDSAFCIEMTSELARWCAKTKTKSTDLDARWAGAAINPSISKAWGGSWINLRSGGRTTDWLMNWLGTVPPARRQPKSQRQRRLAAFSFNDPICEDNTQRLAIKARPS